MYLSRETIGNKVKDLKEDSSQQKKTEGEENLSLYVTKFLNTDFVSGGSGMEMEFWETVSPNYRLVSFLQRNGPGEKERCHNVLME